MEIPRKKIALWTGLPLLAVFLAYVGYVIYFETWLGITQPMGGRSMIFATFDEDNRRNERVLSLVRIDGRNYIAVNHWPRAWYHRALANPEVEVQMPGTNTFAPYRAVPLEGGELERVKGIYTHSFSFRLRTGFPPRRFMRLDPR